MDATRPPCWPDGESCPNSCAWQLLDRTVYNVTPLYGPWSGWRMAGHRLIAPSGEWITARLLDRMLWREAQLYRDLRALKAVSRRNSGRLGTKRPISRL